MKVVNIGLIGFGTVGSGVYSLLSKNRDLIYTRSGIDIRLKSICDLRIDEVKKEVSNIHLTGDWKDIIEDKEIDTIVELIGGIEPAKSIILEALRMGKNVVTANKKLLAEEGREIFELAEKRRPRLGYEASVGGGMPCIQALRDGLIGNNVNSVMGILNGTCNYILTKMEDEALPFDVVLKDAQKKGFAEADPTFDIEGFDTGHKIVILSKMAYNKNIDFNSISIEGITKISDLDITYAKEMGYVIKLLGISKLAGDDIDIRVHPTMISLKHPLASVRNEFNAVMFFGDMTGPVILNGKGAGSLPTASAVISDVIQIAEKRVDIKKDISSPAIAKYIRQEKRMSRYYIRLSTEDRPGILSKISGILANHDISISSVIQKAINTKYVPIIIMTHNASDLGIMQSVKEINDFNFVDGSVTLIRVEDPLDIEGDNDG